MLLNVSLSYRLETAVEWGVKNILARRSGGSSAGGVTGRKSSLRGRRITYS